MVDGVGVGGSGEGRRRAGPRKEEQGSLLFPPAPLPRGHEPAITR